MRTPANSNNSNYSEIFDALSRFDKNEMRRFLKKTETPNLDHIPGSRGLPVMGHAPWLATKSHKWMVNQYEKFGSVFKLRVLHRELLVMVGPEANRMLLKNEDKIFSNFLAYGPTIKNLLDDNVLSLDFTHHKTTRKTLQAAFKRQAVEGHILLMNPTIQAGIANWPTGKTVKSTDYIRKLLLDTGANVFLGLDMGPEADRLNQAFVDMVAGGASILRFKQIPFSPYSKALRARKVMEKFIYANIKKRRNRGEQGRDIFSQLCNAKDDEGNYLDDKEICNQIIFVLFAAHDTTASALSSVFYQLATNQEWQEELRQESLDLGRKDLEFEDFDLLVKTGWTIQEAIRMYPPAPFLPRYAMKDFDFAG